MDTHKHQDRPADWDTLFPAERDLPSDGVFELGMVLGGTVSAGAYTATGPEMPPCPRGTPASTWSRAPRAVA